MNPPQFHIEHGRLMQAHLDREAARHHDAPSQRRRPRASKVRFQLRLARLRHA